MNEHEGETLPFDIVVGTFRCFYVLCLLFMRAAILSIPEVAQRLGVSEQIARRLCLQQRLPARKQHGLGRGGCYWVIPESKLTSDLVERIKSRPPTGYPARRVPPPPNDVDVDGVRLLTPIEAAVVLKVRAQVVRRLCRLGKLGRKVGGRWRIRRDELPGEQQRIAVPAKSENRLRRL